MTSSLSIQTFYCTQAKLDARAVNPGALYYTTDTQSLYLDSADSKRLLFDSVICVADNTELEGLKDAYTPSTEKLYYVKADKTLHIYNGTSFVSISAPVDDIMNSVAEKYGVAFVNSLPAKGVANKLYIVPATDALDGVTKDVYAYNGTAFVKLTVSKAAVQLVADATMINALSDIDTKLAAIKLDFTNATGSTTVSSVEETLSSYYKKSEVDAMFAALRKELGLS